MAEEFRSFLESTRRSPPPPPGTPPKSSKYTYIRNGRTEELKKQSGLTMIQMAKELREYFERFKPIVIEINKVIIECPYCGSVAEEGICNYCGI